ncbi:MAG: hypothetical protein ACE5Q6_16000 [Dehalococcoidia bacterium]
MVTAPAGQLVLFRNIGLTDADTGVQTSNVGEPSVANNGREILVTGNWFASRSLDNGATWDHINPFDYFPPASGGFCCDQVVQYDRSRDLTFWLLQYIADNNSNTLRLAVKQGATLGNNAWYWWDFRPNTVNSSWTNQWFDYPGMSLSNDYLYVTTNKFNINNGFAGAVVFRFPLDDLAAGQNLTYRVWSTTSFGSLRCVQGARDTMYFASHSNRQRIRVWTWPEADNQPQGTNVSVTRWNGGFYQAPQPGGGNWLGRADGRITGAWAANGQLGFMWTANSSNTRPQPHIRVAVVDDTTKQLLAEPDIWSRTQAFAYPDASSNDRGHVGVTFCMSSESIHPSHVVGIRDDFVPNGWDLRMTQAGTDSPTDNKWGDYLNCRRHSPDGLTWIASGYTLQGGTNRRNVEPRVVHFGRGRDSRAVTRWESA